MTQDLGSNTDEPFLTSEHLLSSILFHYSALAPVKNLSFPSNIPFNVTHEFFLRKILLNHHLKQYPPSESYQQSFWKWVLVQLESLGRSDEDDEIDECIYAHYLSLRTGARSETPPNSFITHYWKFPGTHGYPIEEDCYETITLLESRTTIEAGTTGLRTWRASLVLAHYLIQHPGELQESLIIIAASTAIDEQTLWTLVMCSSWGAAPDFLAFWSQVCSFMPQFHPFERKTPSIYLTDVNSTVLFRCQNNVSLPCNKSSSHPNIHYKSLDWLDSSSDQETLKSFFSEAKVDIVLGADIVFDPMLVPPLVKTISFALSSKRTRIAFIALTVRNGETLRYFLDEIGKVLKTEEVAQDITGDLLLQIPDQVDAELEVKIFKVTRARDA
ncbi:hypothetical protein J3R83DRAFT_6182 [Lanmaoa asiatica]|nr:hypothetical protein J3R83DRAFT_6182 [Lanmaoa asiatica]